ncbi:MAG: hypothetical protein ACRDHP_13760 [Ktedonobacterales bacterium]
MPQDSPQDEQFWTAERVERLEQALSLWQEQDTVHARQFFERLRQSQTLDAKRALILDELLPALAHTQCIKLWEGREIVTRLARRDLVDVFLYREGIIENLPTDETSSPEEERERERLSHLFGQGKPVSEIVIEDRGPR